MSRKTNGVIGKILAWAGCVLASLAYLAAVAGSVFGGFFLLSRLMGWTEEAETPPPAEIVLGSGAGPLRIPAPEGMEGRQRLSPPPLEPCAWEVWDEARYEVERWHPYDAELFLPGWNPSLAFAGEYSVPYGITHPDRRDDTACLLLVFAAPGGEAATWDGFRADGRVLENDLAGAAENGKARRLFVGGERSYGYDAAPGNPGDSVRFVWVAGCRFVLRCQDETGRNDEPLDRSVLSGILDGWIGSICEAAGVVPGAPDADETARGDAWAVPRREAGEAADCALKAAEESGLAAFRRFLRHAWIWIRAVLMVTGIGCLSVTIVWGLALVAALAIFGRKRPTEADGAPPRTDGAA